MLVAGDVLGHTAQVPLRKAPEPQMLSYNKLVAHSGVYPAFICMQLGQAPASHCGPPTRQTAVKIRIILDSDILKSQKHW